MTICTASQAIIQQRTFKDEPYIYCYQALSTSQSTDHTIVLLKLLLHGSFCIAGQLPVIIRICGVSRAATNRIQMGIHIAVCIMTLICKALEVLPRRCYEPIEQLLRVWLACGTCTALTAHMDACTAVTTLVTSLLLQAVVPNILAGGHCCSSTSAASCTVGSWGYTRLAPRCCFL